MLTLSVELRGKADASDVRQKGAIPAVMYGPKEKAIAVTIDARDFNRVWKEAGETTLVKITGVGEEKDTLIHDVQVHPVTDVPLHADFYVLEKGKKVEVNIPLEFEGVSPAEKAGHIIVKALHEIEIEVAPAELPHHLVVDMSKLENVGDHVLASQIALPPSATLMTDADEIVASVTEFEEEKAEAPVAAEATPAPAGAEAPKAESKDN